MKTVIVTFCLMLLFVSANTLAGGFPDFDNSGTVDVGGLAMLVSVWLTGGGDQNLDNIGDVNILDFAEFSAWWQWQVPSNLLVNGDFEDGEFAQIDFSASPEVLPGWWGWGKAGWHQKNPSVAVQGTMSVKFWASGTVIAQDFPVTAGQAYEFSMDAINTSGGCCLTQAVAGSLVLCHN